jgi:hypothetical protein
MHPKRTTTALLVLLIGIGAIWFYLPSYSASLAGPHFTPVLYVPSEPVALQYTTSTTTTIYHGILQMEGCNTIVASMLPVGTSTLRYTLALMVERADSCTSVGAVPQAFAASIPLGVNPIFAGVTVNGAIVPYTLAEDK